MVDSGQTAYNSNNVNTRQNEITWRDYLCTIRLVACRCTHDGQCRYELRCGRLCGHGVLHQHRFVPTLVTTARLAQEVSPPYVRNVYVIVMKVWSGAEYQIRFPGTLAHANALLDCGLTCASLGALKPRVLLWRISTLLVPTASRSTATDFAIVVCSARRTSGVTNCHSHVSNVLRMNDYIWALTGLGLVRGCKCTNWQPNMNSGRI